MSDTTEASNEVAKAVDASRDEDRGRRPEAAFVAVPLAVAGAAAVATTSALAWAFPLQDGGAAAAVSLPRYLANPFCYAILLTGIWACLYGLLQVRTSDLERHLLETARRPHGVIRRGLGMTDAAALTDTRGVRDPALGASVAADHFDVRRGARMAPVSYAIWALPLLGFVGTVIGISGAIGGLGAVFADAAREEALKDVLAALRYAFDTTFVGLAMVLPTMAVSVLHKARSDAARHALVAHLSRT